jgi:hypothetical protein
MPTNQRIRLDDNESITPVEASAKLGKRKTDRIGRTPRFPLSLNKQPELFPQKQVLSGNCGWRTETQAKECQRVCGYMECVPN